MLPKPKQYVTIPYSVYRDIRRRLEAERDLHIGRDKIRARFDPGYDPKTETRDSIAAKKINELLVDMDRLGMLEERL